MFGPSAYILPSPTSVVVILEWSPSSLIEVEFENPLLRPRLPISWDWLYTPADLHSIPSVVHRFGCSRILFNLSLSPHSYPICHFCFILSLSPIPFPPPLTTFPLISTVILIPSSLSII